MAGSKQAGPQMPQTEMCPGTCRTFHAVLGMCLWSLFAMGVKHMGALEFEEVSPLGGGPHHPIGYSRVWASSLYCDMPLCMSSVSSSLLLLHGCRHALYTGFTGQASLRRALFLMMFGTVYPGVTYLLSG